MTAISESAEGDYYYDIDPLEKEWMVAAALSNLDTIHRLIMTDPSLVNRRDFIHVSFSTADINVVSSVCCSTADTNAVPLMQPVVCCLWVCGCIYM